jgi:hypothetical protein
MGLVSKSKARERILLYGGAKVGKTSSYLSIAKKCPESTIYVLDSDYAIDRMLEGGDYTNVDARPIDEWPDYVNGVRDITKKMKPDDWLVIDFMSTAWDAVQAYYVEKRYGKEIEDYFLEFRVKKGNAKSNELEGDTDWKVINKLYNAFALEVKKAPGHVLATATARSVGDRDTSEQKSTFGVVGVRPEGQKKIAYDFHTILFVSKDRTGNRLVTTAGERERKWLDKAPLNDFATDYLLKVGGWRPSA